LGTFAPASGNSTSDCGPSAKLNAHWNVEDWTPRRWHETVFNCRFKHFRLALQLACDGRGQDGDRHRNGRLRLDADLRSIVVWRKAAIDFQNPGELVFFLCLANPLKVRLVAAFDATPGIILDAKVIREANCRARSRPDTAAPLL